MGSETEGGACQEYSLEKGESDHLLLRCPNAVIGGYLFVGASLLAMDLKAPRITGIPRYR
ncbi:hypothetical protein D3C87_1979880 [compost metagenome]